MKVRCSFFLVACLEIHTPGIIRRFFSEGKGNRASVACSRTLNRAGVSDFLLAGITSEQTSQPHRVQNNAAKLTPAQKETHEKMPPPCTDTTAYTLFQITSNPALAASIYS